MAVALSACASSRSVFEDLLNLPLDRLDGDRCDQPLAAGKAPLPTMIMVGSVLGVAGIALSFGLAPRVGLVVLLYAFLGLCHLLWLRTGKPAGIFSRWLLNVFPLPAGLSVAPVHVPGWISAFWSG